MKNWNKDSTLNRFVTFTKIIVEKNGKKNIKFRFMSSTFSAQHELIKHECKVFPPSLIIIALLLNLRIQLNLILQRKYTNSCFTRAHAHEYITA